MRTFVTVSIDDAIKLEVFSFLKGLRDLPGKIRWAGPETLHLTLQFLGETDPAAKDKITQALRAVASRHRPFPMSLEGVGGFPSLDGPRVLWIGVRQGAEELKVLADAIKEALRPLGFEPEARPFTAHATVGRVKQVPPGDILAATLQPHAGRRFGQQDAKVLTWFASELSPQGAKHTVLENITLGK